MIIITAILEEFDPNNHLLHQWMTKDMIESHYQGDTLLLQNKIVKPETPLACLSNRKMFYYAMLT